MSKKCYLLILILLNFANLVNAQVTIGSSITPNKDALLDLKENTNETSSKGLALPRVSLVSTLNPSPMSEFHNGMVVYNISTNEDGSNSVEPGFYYSDGFQWIELKSIKDVIFPTEPWRVAENAEQATQNTQNIYQDGQVLIGATGQVDNSAQLEISSTDRGILVPRLTTIQRDAIEKPTESLLIWNSDIGCFNFRKNGKWRVMCGDLEESDIAITSTDCSSAKIVGTYKEGIPLGDTNYLMVTVQVIEAGSFSIQADSKKGFFFQKTGSFPSPGTYTVKLEALGTPKEAGSFNITLNVNGENTNCSIPITVEAAAVEFNYIEGTAHVSNLVEGKSSEGQTLTIDIDVINPGTFNFSTVPAYGIQFTLNNQTLDSGKHTIVLHATGVPTVSGEKLMLQLEGTGMKIPFTTSINIVVEPASVKINCGNATVNGIYKLHIPTTASNFIDIPVDFISTGTWNATTDTISGISFSGSGTATKEGNASIRLYATGTPNNAGTKTFSIQINKEVCKIDVTTLLPPKNVLLIGYISPYISMALDNTSNFGATGISKVENINIIKGPNNPSATDLANLINQNNIHVIVAGWKFDASDGAASVVADFIKNKKGYFFWAQSQGLQNAIATVLDKTFNTSITFTQDKYPIRAAILPKTDSPYINGVFGNLRGKYLLADDNLSWMGVSENTKEGVIKWFVELPESNGYPARNTFLYADGFFMFPDWGMLGRVGGYYGNNSPISFNAYATGTTSIWNGSAIMNAPIAIGDVANWVLFGNVMNHAFEYVDDNIAEDYEVSEIH